MHLQIRPIFTYFNIHMYYLILFKYILYRFWSVLFVLSRILPGNMDMEAGKLKKDVMVRTVTFEVRLNWVECQTVLLSYSYSHTHRTTDAGVVTLKYSGRAIVVTFPTKFTLFFDTTNALSSLTLCRLLQNLASNQFLLQFKYFWRTETACLARVVSSLLTYTA